MNKKTEKMKLFSKRDIWILLILWNVILTGAVVFMCIVGTAAIEESRHNNTVLMNSDIELRQQLYELEQK